MTNVYENHYGTSFGFWLDDDFYHYDVVTEPTGSPKTNYYYEKIDDTYVLSNDVAVDPTKTYYRKNTIGWNTASHSFRDFGLYPKGKPVISAPEVQLIQYEVPGRDGLYDATEALTGDVHYKNRTGKWEFTQTGGRKKWDSTYYWLKNKLHGQQKGIVIDEEKDGYYIGRISVEEPSYDDKKGIAYFAITADLEPWKNAWTRAKEKWLWDPFSFENGVIQPDMGRQSVTSAVLLQFDIHGVRKPVVPHVFAENVAGQTLSDGDLKLKVYNMKTATPQLLKTYNLEAGPYLSPIDNVDRMPDFVIHQTDYIRLEFVCASGVEAFVSVSYRNGWL